MKTLKEISNIILRQTIKVVIDHKNTVHELDLKTSQREMTWRLLLEEYRPEIEYTKGSKNAVADALRRLQKQDKIVVDDDTVLLFVPVHENIFPL